MSNQLLLVGLLELKRELAAFPTASAQHAAGILETHATRAQAAIVAAYPVITGEMREKVVVKPRRSFRSLARVAYDLISGAFYARFYEFGTVHQRARPIFFPTTSAGKRAATADVVAYVETQGIRVTGARD